MMKTDDAGRKLCPHCSEALDLLRYANRPWPIVIIAGCLNRSCAVYGQTQEYSEEEWHGK